VPQLAIAGGTPVRSRPFHAWPLQTREQVEAVAQVIQSGRWSRHLLRDPDGLVATGDPASPWQTDLFEREVAEFIGVSHALAVSSGTVAMDLVMRALGIGPGDEVIVPAYASIGTATCVLESNAIPVFADIDPHTYTIAPKAIARCITPRTRAIVVCHVGGRICDMDVIGRLGDERGLAVVEDARHAMGSRRADGRAAGTFGRASAFSFGPSSILTAGEGGLIVTSDPVLDQQVRVLHDHGLELVECQPRNVAFGTSARMTELQAALLRAQLPRLEGLNERRHANVKYFYEAIQLIGGLEMTTPPEPEGFRCYRDVILRYEPGAFAGAHRNRFVRALQAEGIPCSCGYDEPIYATPLFREQRFLKGSCPVNCCRVGKAPNFAHYKRTCPNAERAARDEAVWFPHRLFVGPQSDVDDILYAIHKLEEHADELAAED